MVGTAGATVTVTGLAAGQTYYFAARACDLGATVCSAFSNEVSTTIQVPANQPPTANAGPDQTVTIAAGQTSIAVTLNGSGSSDPNGTIATYNWTGTPDPANTVSPTVTLAAGSYTFTLVVTDNNGATSAADTVNVTVNPAPNQPPTANAGPDQTVTIAAGQTSIAVTLNGSGSSDPNGTIASYSWTGTPDPANTVSPTVTLAAGTYTFSLVVTDNNGATSAADTVNVTVNPAPNQPPTANAGPDQTVTIAAGQTSIAVTLNGSGSLDPNGTIASYSWTGTPDPANTVSPTVTLAAGSYTFTLVVTDNNGATSAADTVNVTVNPAPNQPPTANAGPDQTVTIAAGQTSIAVTLNGSGSSDPNGTIASYNWTGTPDPANTVSPTVTLAAGSYTFTLVVTDNNGATSAADTVNVTVNPAPNQPPTANAGPDQTVTIAAGQTSIAVTLNGSGSSDPNGTIASYNWTGTPDPANTVSPTVTLAAGSYTFSLVVTDNNGANSAADTVVITVNPAPNQPPTANAGPDQTVTIAAGQTSINVTLNGIGSSDPDGTIATYNWTGTPDPANTVSPTVTLAAGSYTFSLVVTDNKGANSAADTVYVQVLPPAPVADFAANVGSGLAPLTTTFSCKSSGDITARGWDFGDGGTSTAATAVHTYTVPGTYAVSLWASGPGGEDTEVKSAFITVNAPAPVADFTGDVLQGPAPLTVTFHNASTGQFTASAWNFGDGSTSDQTHPTHTYTEPGLYAVTLTVSGGPGGSNTRTRSDYVQVDAAEVPMEVGELLVNDQWQRVDFQTPFTDPIVVASPLSNNDGAPAVVRIYGVDPEGFWIRVQEWGYLDGKHANEAVSYTAIERGRHQLPNGAWVEAGRLAKGTIAFAATTFSEPFAEVPVVFSTVTSVNEADAVVTRMRQISVTGFQVRMQEQEVNKQKHLPESIDYIAWEPSFGVVNGLRYEVGRMGALVSHSVSTLVYQAAFAQPPIFLADMQTTNGGDTANLRWLNRTEVALEVWVSEEQSRDAETAHVAESVGYFVADEAQ